MTNADGAAIAGPTDSAVRLLVVPCGRSKLDHPAPARQLYTGDHFRWVLASVEHAAAQARAAGVATTVLILSARHGLVDPDTTLEPYDITMTDPGSVTAGQIARQLGYLVTATTQVTAYLPRAYLTRLEAAAARCTPPVPVVDAFASARGIGDQRRVIATLIRETLAGI